MLNIVTENPIVFLLAIVIGLATAWWIWGRLPAVEAEPEAYRAPEPAPPSPAPEPAPVAPPVAPVAPVAAAAAAPVAEGRPKIAAAVGAPDDLKRVKGIGPKLEKLCNSLGVSRFDQIAAWSSGEIAEVDAHLGSFKGRIIRDEWTAQAALLAAGDDAGHAARYGK